MGPPRRSHADGLVPSQKTGDSLVIRHETCHTRRVIWWIVGIVAVWLLVGGFIAYWLGRSISHTKLEESAAEMRRADKHEPQPDGTRIETTSAPDRLDR